MKSYLFYFNITILLLLAACSGREKSKTVIYESADKLHMTHATGIAVNRHTGYYTADIKNPWKEGEILHSYALLHSDNDIPDKIPAGTTIIRTPLKKVLVYSSVHANAIKELGHIDAIGGVCDAQYFTIEEISNGIANGSIIDAGSSMSPDIEKIIALSPDAIILSPYQNVSYGALTSLGIPIVECADYMEASPLGRAEWIKFFGALFQEDKKADSIHSAVVSEYNFLQQKAKNIKNKPQVLSENIINGTWYVPGGNSYMAQLFADAGGKYAWSDTHSSGSIPLDMPQVLEKAHNADVWLLKSFDSSLSYSKLKSQNELNAQFKAFKTKNIYFCDTGNTTLFQDFPFHPEVLLKEYIAIFHPGMIPDYTQKYFKPLNDE